MHDFPPTEVGAVDLPVSTGFIGRNDEGALFRPYEDPDFGHFGPHLISLFGKLFKHNI
jgi:hypothetical protein